MLQEQSDLGLHCQRDVKKHAEDICCDWGFKG